MKYLYPLFMLVTLFSCAEESVSVTKPALKPTKPTASGCIPIQEISYSNGTAFYLEMPFSGKICSYHSNGELHTLTSYHDGAKSRLWEIYFANGQKEKSGFTRKGSDDGTYREWYANGKLKYEYHYDLGKKVGIWKSWYENGTRYTERHFENDALNGKVLVWDESGKLAKEYDYVNGRLMNSQMHFKEEDY